MIDFDWLLYSKRNFTIAKNELKWLFQHHSWYMLTAAIMHIKRTIGGWIIYYTIKLFDSAQE